MKTKNNGTTAAQVNERENRVNIQALPAGEYGDLCYDYFGKGSVIVFGNTDDHAAQLEAIGGKYGDRLRYSALQNGRKWTEKQGRTAGYYFTTEGAKREAIQYVQRVNHAIFDRYEQSTAGMEGVIQRPADFKAGDRVRTIHGLGTVTEHTPKYNAAQSVCVKLDKFTYNYGWKGMPQTFIECRCDEITHYSPSEKSGAKAFQKGDRVERIGTGATGTIDDVNTYEGQLTYIVKYDETQRRQSDGFEYLTEEVFAEEITDPNHAAHKQQEREFGQAFDAEYYKPIIEAIKGRKVFHFGTPADTVRLEVRRECEGYYRIRMKRAESSYVETMSEYIDWETILNNNRAARLLSDLRADHTRAHRFKLGDMVRVSDREFGQIFGHVGRITKVYLINQLVGTRYTVDFIGELPKYRDGQPMKENDFEPLDIEPAD